MKYISECVEHVPDIQVFIQSQLAIGMKAVFDLERQGRTDCGIGCIPIFQELFVIACREMDLSEEFVSLVGVGLDVVARLSVEVGMRLITVRIEHFIITCDKIK
jgi:hypothetical protein